MSHENFADKMIDNFTPLADVDFSKSVKSLVDFCKEKYFRAMDSYCDFVDRKNISPNQVGTLRTAAGVATGAALASGDYGVPLESVGVGIMGILFAHDAVDGHLARRTQQTSPEGETYDALVDKVKVFALIAILLVSMNVSPTILIPIVGFTGVLLIQDFVSQYMRGNNVDAMKAFWKKPLTQEQRDANPNKKSKGASVFAGKVKTGAIMGGVTLGFMEDIPLFEWSEENALPLLVSILIANGFAAKSLNDKGVFKKKAA